MKIPNIDREIFDTLYNGVKNNIDKYRQGTGDWIYDYWREKGYIINPGGLEIDVVSLDPTKNDVDNAIALYEGLSISPMIASSAMFWTIYAHSELSYLLEKKPLTGNDSDDTNIIKTHYLASWDDGGRSLWRRVLPKLWWTVEVTVDDSRVDRYELTKEAFMHARTQSEILERPGTTMNRKISKQLLENSIKQRAKGTPLLTEEMRRLTSHLNAVGRTICVDVLEREELDGLIEDFIIWLRNDGERA